MKYLLYILPLALVVCSACGESHKSSERDDNNNERKRIGWNYSHLYEYYVEPDGQMYLSHIYKKNVDGKEIERGSYNSDGELTNVYTYEYDSNGNLSSSTKTSFVGDNYAEYIVYKYDDLNNIVSECRKNIYGSYEYTVFLEFEIIF